MSMFMTLLILTTLSPSSRAAVMYGDVDVSPMVEHFRKQVVTLKKQVVTYNWGPGEDTTPWFTWTSPWAKIPTQAEAAAKKAAADRAAAEKALAERPAMLKGIRQSATAFWRAFGSSSTSMYGAGLYTAVDPVVTREFGGKGAWQLLEITFPAGTRILDLPNKSLVNKADTALAESAQKVERMFDCPAATDADAYFTGGGSQLSPKCADLIYFVFDRMLGIQAFAYGYSSSRFKECGYGDTSRAFVVTRPDLIRSATVKIFTAQTTTDQEARLRIQTLFAKAATDQMSSPWEDYQSKQMLLDHLNAFPERDLHGSKTVCSKSKCVITVEFCDSAMICDSISLPEMRRPGGPTIIADEFSDETHLLWPDLIGQPKSDTVSTWLKENKFSCGGTFPYDAK